MAPTFINPMPPVLDSSSDTDDHFSDAKSGPDEPPSPIPKTRVEKVDDEPSYGEVPGTEAYRMREEDAQPDEIAIIPDPDNPSRSRAQSYVRPPTPGGHPIPKTLVEETPDSPGSVTHPEVEKKHRADPPPDLVLKAGRETATERGPVSGTDV
jgi:hypothetical protein